MRLPRPIDAATQARVSAEGRRCLNPPSLQSPSVMSARLFARGLRRQGVSNPLYAVTRLLDGRHHLERFAMEQAGEVDYLITWRDNEFAGRVSLTPCRRAGANRRCFALPWRPIRTAWDRCCWLGGMPRSQRSGRAPT